jgi:thioredoxin 1
MLSIIYVSEDWCDPCKSFWPAVSEVCQTQNVSLSKVNTSHQSVQSLGITNIPTVLIYKDGNLVHRFAGATPKNKLEALIKSI